MVAAFGPGTEVNFKAPRQRGHTTVAVAAVNIARICADSAGENGSTPSRSGTPQGALATADGARDVTQRTAPWGTFR